jgi:hypothetical protein
MIINPSHQHFFSSRHVTLRLSKAFIDGARRLSKMLSCRLRNGQPDASIWKARNGGEFEWCPTLAVAMPDEVFWPGKFRRDHVMRVAEQAQARAIENSILKERLGDL